MSAAAGGKRKKSTKKSKKALKGLVRRIPHKVMGITIGKNPFASSEPRFFSVLLNDATIYCDAAGSVKQFDSNLSAVPWMSLGAAFADSTGANAALQFGFSTRIAMTDIHNYVKFTDLFQKFAVLKYEVKVNQMCSSYGGAIIPTVYSAPDDNDSTVFASQDEVNGYQNVKEHPLAEGVGFTRACVPKPAQSLFLSAVGTGYANQDAPLWVDTNSAGVPFYCMKFYVRNFIAAPNSGMSIRVQPRVWIACKNTH